MRKKTVSAGVGVVALAACANAQLTSIGPFTGNAQEGFEAVPGYTCPPCFYACFESTFGGAASMCDNNPGGTGMHATGGWSFQCQIGPHGGGWLFGSAGGAVNITFEGTVTKFGGYMGDNGLQGSGTATFFDAAGGQIGKAQALTLNGCTWEWNGWESTVPVKQIRIAGALYGGHILLDDCEAEVGGVICYPDCNGVGGLTIADFGCFQTAFVAGDPYADCNGVGGLTIADFACFQTAFVAGCP